MLDAVKQEMKKYLVNSKQFPLPNILRTESVL
jgi:hypothetical protein